MTESDRVPVGGDGAGVGSLVPRPQVVDPQVVAPGETVPRVRTDHHVAGGQHVGPVLPDHHELAEVLGVTLQDHFVTHRSSVSARLRGDDGADGDRPVVRLVGHDGPHHDESSEEVGVCHLCVSVTTVLTWS